MLGAGSEHGAVVRTFLLTDIEGSTRTWQSAPDGMATALEMHDAILASTIDDHDGTVVKHTGDGMFAVFASPRSAAEAAVRAQRALLGAVPFSVRMAITTGEARPRGVDWFGPAVNRCARLLDAAHGGQILVSAASAALLRDLPLGEMRLDDLGEHRLKDLPDAQGIFQLTVAGLPERHPPLRTAAAPVHTIPATRTALVGREHEVEELQELLQRTRLVTITGVGGVGKTRLAVEVASRVVDRYPGGVFFVELATVTTNAGVAAEVARAAGIDSGTLAAPSTPLAQVTAFLVGRNALLVLDNCEHVLDDCADLVDALLDRCASLTILTTSREPLAVDGEQVWRAPSLSTDGNESEAVRLFFERTDRHLRAEREVGEVALAEEICRHLDGIPLAIELAAAQTSHLSLDEIARRLSDRFSLLTGGRRRVQRQQTLLAAVDWSHDLLTDAERQLLRRLAVFPGWFDIAAVEAVCSDALSEQVVHVLGALVAKSLVAPDTRRDRYRLLETIRLYSEDRLVAAGEAEVVRERHCQWVFGTLQRLSDSAQRTLDGIEAMSDLADDLRAALHWSVSRGELARAATALSWSGTYWWFTGRHDEGLQWMDMIDAADLNDFDRAGMLGLRAAMLLGRGDVAGALATAEAAQRADPDERSANRLQADVIVALVLLSAPGAHERVEELIRRARRFDDPYFLRQARDYRAHLQFVSDPHGAVAEWEDLVETSDRDRRGVAEFFALLDLGGARHLTGDHAGALAAADERDRRGYSIGRAWTGMVATYLRALGHAGIGYTDQAWEHVRTLREEVQRTGRMLTAKDCALGCAATLIAEGEFQRAAAVLGALRGTAAMNVMSPISFAVHRHYRHVVRDRLGDRVARQLYDDARDHDYLALVDDELGR